MGRDCRNFRSPNGHTIWSVQQIEKRICARIRSPPKAIKRIGLRYGRGRISDRPPGKNCGGTLAAASPPRPARRQATAPAPSPSPPHARARPLPKPPARSRRPPVSRPHPPVLPCAHPLIANPPVDPGEVWCQGLFRYGRALEQIGRVFMFMALTHALLPLPTFIIDCGCLRKHGRMLDRSEATFPTKKSKRCVPGLLFTSC